MIRFSAEESLINTMPKIVLIEDDPISRGVLRSLLKKNGWEVLEAEDGEQGLTLALEQQPDVVICDLMMPRSNGFNVCRAIRCHPNGAARIRIIITSASTYEIDKTTAFEAGADEYLVKPVEAGKLVELVNTYRTDQNGPQTDRTISGGVPSQGILPLNASEPVRLKFWGVRGSIPSPGPDTVIYGGNTSCVEVRADGELIIMDAGSGIRPLGLSLAKEFKDRPVAMTLLLTHTHWDHIQGFPFFAPAYNPKNALRIMSYECARKHIQAALEDQMESPYFPITMKAMPGKITVEELKDMEFEVGTIKVRAAFTNHPGVCVGYRLFTSAGSIAYLPDNELFQRQKTEQAAEDTKEQAENYARAKDEQLIEFLKGADVLMLDCQYDAAEYPRFVGWGHSCVEDSVRLAIKAEVKQFFMFHHDPTHSDVKVASMLERAREIVMDHGSPMQVEAATEGVEVVLKPRGLQDTV